MAPLGMDTVIECVGFDYTKSLLSKVETTLKLATDSPDVLAEMIHVCKKNGIVSILGVYSGYANHFPIGAMMEKGLRVEGGQSPTQKYWHMCLEFIQKGLFDTSFLNITRGKLSEAPELYDKFDKKENGVIKVFLRPDHFV